MLTSRLNASHAAILLLVHDIVEIDAGDAPIHAGGVLRTELETAEREAAERIFGLLPAEQAARFRDMWLEFEAGQSAEARFAKALDRLQPLLLNIKVGGGTWRENGVSEQEVVERYGSAIKGGSTTLWRAARDLIRAHFDGTPS